MHMRPGMYAMVDPPAPGSIGSGVGCGRIATPMSSVKAPGGTSSETAAAAACPPPGPMAPSK